MPRPLQPPVRGLPLLTSKSLILNVGNESNNPTGAADHFRWTWTAADEAAENTSDSAVA